MHEALYIWGLVWHHFKWIIGVSGPDGSGVNQPYNAWSAFLSDISELAIISYAAHWYIQHKCSTCFRVPIHPLEVEGTVYKTCKKHSTAEHHKQLFKLHKEKFAFHHKLLNKK